MSETGAGSAHKAAHSWGDHCVISSKAELGLLMSMCAGQKDMKHVILRTIQPVFSINNLISQADTWVWILLP